MKQIKNCKAFLPFAFLLLISAIAQAQDSKIQAIFLYKFIEYVHWPDSRKELVIGIVGETEVQDEFEKMLKARGNNNLTVKKIKTDEASTCDVIFLPESQNSSF